MAEGIDYSYARPKPTDIVKAGKKFVVRYITPPGPGNKGIDRAEFDALKEAGLEVVVVWEGAARDALQGRERGIADAKAAQHGLDSIVNLNDRLPVYFAVDWDATPTEMRTVQAYFGGACSVLGVDRVGVYAGATQLQAVRTAKNASWFWQTVAWSRGIVLSGIHLYQYRTDVEFSGGKVDLVKSLATNYGQRGVTPKPPVVSASLVNGKISGVAAASFGAEIVSGTVTVVDSNGKKTTAKLSV